MNFKFFEEYNELIKTKYPSILAVDQQLSFRDFDKLTNKFTRELLFQQLEPMSVNHKFLQRQSLYRTMTNWLKKEYEAQKLLKWMELWEKFYSRIMPGQEYYWTWKKKIACREIATKVRRSLEVSDKYPEGTVFTDQDVENSFLAFLNKLPEFYQNKKPSPITINQNYNEIVAEIRASDEKRKKHLKNGENKSAATRARETGRRKDFE